MKLEQIYGIVNQISQEVTGEAPVLEHDLSNIVDVGKAITDAYDKETILNKLLDKVGKTVFVDRVYTGRAPSVLHDAWEYGSIVEKIRSELPDAVANASWELRDGESVDGFKWNKPAIDVKLFNSKTTFEVDLSVTDVQLKSAFNSAEDLNRLVSMLYNEVDKKLTVAIDNLIMATIANAIGTTMAKATDTSGNPVDYRTTSTSTSVNLLKLYNDEKGATLRASQAITDKEFIRYASMVMKNYIDRMSTISKLFNIGRKAVFTPSDKLKIVMLSEFKNAAGTYLQSDVYNEQYTKLPECETVAFWQGSGQDYSFDSTSKIHITHNDMGVHDFQASGILAVMFDHEALGVCNQIRRVTSQYVAKQEFTNLFYKQECSYFNDFDENFVVFHVSDSE